MPSIYSIMDISRWALQATTRQLDTVSHNVANVNTEGYSRQEVILSTANPEYASEGWYGHGVRVSSVIQHVDALLADGITEKITDVGYYNARLAQLQRLESLANESSDSGLGNDITAFFSAWQDLANNPQSTAVREVLNETANNLVSRLHDIMNDLNDVQRDMNSYLESGVNQVNDLCLRIADLNAKIVSAEAGGNTANDMRDQRQVLINELSEYLPLQWFEDSKGSVTVIAGAGKTLVQDDVPSDASELPLDFVEVAGYDDPQVVWRGLDQPMDAEEVGGGKIGAWLEVRDEDIPDMMSFMDDLAASIIVEVNKIHSQGAGLEKFSDVTGAYEVNNSTTAFNNANNTLPFANIIQDGTLDIWVYDSGGRGKYTINVSESDTLADLAANINAALAGSGVTALVVDDTSLRLSSAAGAEFAFGGDTSNVLAALGINTYFDGFGASSMELNADIAADSRLIAAGRLLDDGEHAVGDNSNALDIADLKDADTMSGSTETFNEALISWASQLGSDVAAASDNLSFSQTTYNQLMTLRDDTSAVSLDEEMIMMIRFQRAYQMAAKMISVADQLMLSILETKR